MKSYHLLNYINGEWVGDHLDKIQVFNPATGEVVGSVPWAGYAETKQAIEAASRAFKSWSQKTASERAGYMKRLHDLMKQNRQELAELITLEMGRPYQETLGEVDYAASFMEWFAEEGKRVYGRTVPGKAENHRIQVLKQPLGVVAAITPWNFPASMITRKMAPALASGCTFIVKPSELTPLTALKLAELSHEAGIPGGVVNVVCGKPKEFTDAVMNDMRVRKISFTGSTQVGRSLMQQSATQIKRVSLELGGHAPFVVCDDADLELAANALMASKFRNNGQTCVCANRIYVQDSIYDVFVEKLANKIRNLKVGNGMNQDTDVGPLINQKSYEKVANHVENALENGARCLVGGKGNVDLDKQTYFFEPTLLADITSDMLVMNEETFGPIAPIQRFTDDEEAIELANSTPFGLAAYVFTQNVKRGVRITEALEFGIVGWNDGVPSVAQAPFGGVKQSGLGREGAKEGLEEYLNTKYISLLV
jgi:succinate-semialdehyde dehydrogenase/glutarate-semialdehyde dehydrogenase